MTPSVTIAITRHDEPDELLLGALDCLQALQKVSATVLVMDQQPSSDIEKYCVAPRSGAVNFQYCTLAPCGISRARNTALKITCTDLLLFTEPDARVSSNWAFYLCQTLSGGAVIVGGRILPEWECRPLIVASTGLIMDLYSLLDMGGGRRTSTKVIGCNFGIHISALGDSLAYFDENYGRSPGTLEGGEEIDLCNRAANNGLCIMYDGRALIRHRITRERISYRWLARRIHAAGKSRALKGGTPRPTNNPGVRWTSLLLLPLYCVYILGFLSYKYEARRLVAFRSK
jgi:hypothetical protein